MGRNKVKTKKKNNEDCEVYGHTDIIVKTNRTQEEIEAAIEREREKMKTMTVWPLM